MIVDSERSNLIGQKISRKGILVSVAMVEQGYVVYVLEAHGRGKPDAYGSHNLSFMVAIPRHLLHLNTIAALYYHFNFKNSSQSIGQTVNQRIAHPPCRSFVEPLSPQQTYEQRENVEQTGVETGEGEDM
jgi:hypothetical protein